MRINNIVNKLKDSADDTTYITINIPPHFLSELHEIDKSSDVTLRQRILIAIGEYIIGYKERKTNKEAK